MSFFDELKRRNVFRVGIAYVVSAWAIAQVAQLVLDSTKAPDWVMQSLLLVLGLGLVVALIISWAYELTPEGIKREEDVVRDESIANITAKKLDVITLAALVVVVGLVAWQQFKTPAQNDIAQTTVAQSAGDAPVAAKQTTSSHDDERSIAVLPFVALSTDVNDGYFGKGLAEELLNALAQFPQLKVAARTSAFSYSNKDVDLREIGEALGVAHVLEGSVRRSGDRLRITAQLIRVADGFHLWSETYERKDTDVFVIQDEIVAELSRVLQIRLGIGAGAGRAANRNVKPRAYEEYLRGLDLWWNRENLANRTNAIKTFRRATELDPTFADAWSAYGASLALSNLSVSAAPDAKTLSEQVVTSLDRALEIDPRNVRAHAALVFWSVKNEINIPLGKQHLELGLAVAQNDAFMIYAAANYTFAIGDIARSMEYYEQSISLDPLNRTVARNRFVVFANVGRYDEAVSTVVTSYPCGEAVCQYMAAHYSLLNGVLVASSKEEIRARRDAAAESPLNQGENNLFLVMSAYVDSILGDRVVPGVFDSIDLRSSSVLENALQMASILARFGEIDRALDMLFAGYEHTGATINNSDMVHTLAPGRLEMPETIRRHPRYHEYWNLPSMPELAAARRANGQPAGLPLPIEGTSE